MPFRLDSDAGPAWPFRGACSRGSVRVYLTLTIGNITAIFLARSTLASTANALSLSPAMHLVFFFFHYLFYFILFPFFFIALTFWVTPPSFGGPIYPGRLL